MTERVAEALNAAYTRALNEHNTQTTPEHMLAAMLEQERGIAPDILAKAGADPKATGARRGRSHRATAAIERCERR